MGEGLVGRVSDGSANLRPGVTFCCANLANALESDQLVRPESACDAVFNAAEGSLTVLCLICEYSARYYALRLGGCPVGG